jgi:hypothetical protein
LDRREQLQEEASKLQPNGYSSRQQVYWCDLRTHPQVHIVEMKAMKRGTVNQDI